MKYGLSAKVRARLQTVFAQHPAIDKVIIYGSRAKGSYHEGSDIDLTLVGDKLALSDLYAIDEDLDQLDLAYTLDLSLYGQIDNQGLIEHIERWGEVFYRGVEKAGAWETRRLGDVCSLDKSKFKGSNLPYVGLEDIEGNTGKFLGDYKPKKVTSSTFKFTNKHVLYGRLRPYLNKVLVPEFEGHCSSEIFPILPSNLVNKSFLFYWLTSSYIVTKTGKTCTGTRMPRANVNEILNFDFPLPPITEQKHIVTLLDLVFAEIKKARANAEQNLKNARELFESYLQQVFSQRGDGFIETTLAEISVISSGGTPAKSNSDFWNGDIAWYSSGELNDLYTINPKEQITIAGLQGSNAKLFPKGSLLIGMYDTAALKMSILDRDGAFNQAIAGVKPNKDINLIFILHAINFIKPELLKMRRGVRQKNLNQSKIKSIPVFLPSLEKQNEIVQILHDMNVKTKQLEKIYQAKIIELDELKKSILQKAFMGKLTNEFSI